MKREPDVRVIVHDKSSLAPEGHSLAFSLGTDAGFSWLDGYNDISSEELLCGISSETKNAAAEELIRSMLSDGKEVSADEIFRTAEGRNISRRTVNEAKKNIPSIETKNMNYIVNSCFEQNDAHPAENGVKYLLSLDAEKKKAS